MWVLSFLHEPSPASFIYFWYIYKQTKQFLQQIYVKNFNPQSGTVIRTHNLMTMSLLP